MSTGHWRDLEQSQPELAAIGRQRLRRHLMAWLATINPEGSLRIHPVTPYVADDGVLYVFMEPTSPKAKDLQGDGRHALHCHVPDIIGTGHGEFLVSGHARLVTDGAPRAAAVTAVTATGFCEPPDRQVLFALGVDRAQGTTGLDDPPVWLRWTTT